ncbi:hypothetical protein KIPB_002023, partial [Kipferlia bialata]
IHAYDTTTDTWACWGEAPMFLDAAICMNIDAETALLFGVERQPVKGDEVPTLCYRVQIGGVKAEGVAEPVNLLLETPAKREAVE